MTNPNWLAIGIGAAVLILGIVGGLFLWTRHGSKGGNDT
jgi:hypothetical protein